MYVKAKSLDYADVPLLKFLQLLIGVSQLISMFVQNSYHLPEPSEAMRFSWQLILSICDSSQLLSQDISLRQQQANSMSKRALVFMVCRVVTNGGICERCFQRYTGKGEVCMLFT